MKRWNFCPQDATKLDVTWKYCPECGAAIQCSDHLANQTVSIPTVWPIYPMYPQPSTAWPVYPGYPPPTITCQTSDRLDVSVHSTGGNFTWVDGTQ